MVADDGRVLFPREGLREFALFGRSTDHVWLSCPRCGGAFFEWASHYRTPETDGRLPAAVRRLPLPA
jgi:hypothetical protein